MELRVRRPIQWIPAILAFTLAGVFFLGLSGLALGNFLARRPTADYVVPGIFGILMSLGFIVLTLVSLRGLLFPRTLLVNEQSLSLFVGNQLLGQVPLKNLADVEVLFEQQQANPAQYGGGLAGGIAAWNAAKKRPTGIILVLRSMDAPGTSWPAHMLLEDNKVCIRMEWDMANDKLGPRIQSLLKPGAEAKNPPLEPAESNPFDFN